MSMAMSPLIQILPSCNINVKLTTNYELYSEMDRPIVRSNFLILRGVTPSDFSSDIIFNKPETAIKFEPTISYTNMPKRFITPDQWPKSSNLRCWYCDQTPISYPRFIPSNPVLCNGSTGDSDSCDAYGHFCEWNCAIRYIYMEFPKEQQWDAIQLISLFESKFSLRRREKILPCPPKTLMKVYCGSEGITPGQWRDKLVSLNNEYDLTSFRMDQLR